LLPLPAALSSASGYAVSPLPLPLPPPPQVNLQCAPDQALELSDAAALFLAHQFELHDSAGQGVLAITDLDRLFSTSPSPAYQVGGRAEPRRAGGRLPAVAAARTSSR
jgi:hypothetical protein